MAWSNDQQAARAIMALLASIPGLSRCWALNGPSEEAVSMLADGSLSSGERTMLRVAFDFWNSNGHADFGTIMHTLGSTHLQNLCTLALALDAGGEAIEIWIHSRMWRGANGQR